MAILRLWLPDPRKGPLHHEGLVSRVLPFAGAALTGLALISLDLWQRPSRALLIGVGLSAITMLTAALIPWSRLPVRAQVVPPLIYMAAVASLVQADGGWGSGYEILYSLPLVWLSLYGTGRDIVIGFAVMAGCFALPLVAIGAPFYSVQQVEHPLLWLMVFTVIAPTAQLLVTDIRQKADGFARLAESVSRVAADPDPRRSVCETAVSLVEADIAALVEVAGDDLVCTASAGRNMTGVRLNSLKEPSGSAVALRSGKALFVEDAASSELVSQRMVASTGASSVLFQPVFDGSIPIGVLVVAFSNRLVRPQDGALHSVAVLAHEAALAIRRSEAVVALDLAARTDPLTGCLNRRAWDETLPVELARATRLGYPLVLVALDLDDFKKYNDTHGHPAGDALLVEVTQRWRKVLRTHDVVARLGGDEFAILMPGCDVDEAQRVIRRLEESARSAGSACSCGKALFDGSSTASVLSEAADSDLYRAKRSRAGRPAVMISRT